MRALHSFTLTPQAAEIVQSWKKGTKSGRVSTCIIKYGNDYRLNPEGVRYWQETVGFLQDKISERNKTIDELMSKQGVKHHLVGLFKALYPFGKR
jgi:hypothetical protein